MLVILVYNGIASHRIALYRISSHRRITLHRTASSRNFALYRICRWTSCRKSPTVVRKVPLGSRSIRSTQKSCRDLWPVSGHSSVARLSYQTVRYASNTMRFVNYATTNTYKMSLENTKTRTRTQHAAASVSCIMFSLVIPWHRKLYHCAHHSRLCRRYLSIGVSAMWVKCRTPGSRKCTGPHSTVVCKQAIVPNFKKHGMPN
jgi:hypothetical protein